jgi:hypothetical protein
MTAAEEELDLEDLLARVDAALAPGTLQEKRAALAALRDSGESTLFEGAVDWSIFVSESDRRLSGGSASLDDAFADILACLAHLSADTAAESEILLAVQLTGDLEADIA